jgi:hypothetical protein
MLNSKLLLCLVFVFTVMAAAKNTTAQQKFPLRPGEWTATMKLDPSLPPSTILYCLNDDLWNKSLTQNGTCTVTQLSQTSSGMSYVSNCTMSGAQIKSTVQMTFDGMQHMTSTGATELTMGGKTTKSSVNIDYRWKGATCTPSDKNLGKK